MFSRRHPYLFTILVVTSIVAVAMIGTSLLFFLGTRHIELPGLGKKGSGKVGVIEIFGVIINGKDVIKKLKHFREDDSIKAIVLRIESPGGSVGPAQEIFREVRKTIKKKKIVASMGTIAASGGYYIAAGANGIMASPGTITGSFGAIMGYTNFQDILEKIGLVPIVIKSGEYKDIGSRSRKMTETEQKMLQNLVDRIHSQFISAISEGRNMDPAKVASLADGRLFLGEEAKELGLIDRLGNIEDAIEWAGRMGGIKGEITAVYAKEKRFSLIRQLVDSSIKALAHQIANPEISADYLYNPAR